MPGDLLVRNARVVLPDRVVREADLRVRGGTVVELTGDVLEPHGEPVLEADGDWLLPGLVDVHCDAIEREVQPRPGVCLPVDAALAELDGKLALCGVTTVFHAVSFGAGEGVRSNELAAALVRAIAALGRRRTLVRHRAHVRLDVSNGAALPLVAALIEERAVGMLSFMDHTPGQGQHRDPKRYPEHLRTTSWAAEDEVDRIVAQKLAGRALVGEEDLRALADRAEAAWLPLAGHDPDTLDAVDRAIERGAGLVAFPVTLEAARYAADRGVHVCVGAPNVLHGRPHDGDLSARAAIAADAADVLCSDYYPAGLLQAVFALARDGAATLAEAVAMATANAAAAAGLQNAAGVIAPGWPADLVLVADDDGWPRVQGTVVDGELVLAVRQRSGGSGPAAPALAGRAANPA